MGEFAVGWGHRNPVPTVEFDGVDGALVCVPEPAWFDYFAVAAPCEARHANHAHIIVTQVLTPLDELKLAALGLECGLRIAITRNDDEWLAKRKSVTEHACKIRYTVNHLRRSGSDYRMSPPETPWIRRANATWARWRRTAAA